MTSRGFVWLRVFVDRVGAIVSPPAEKLDEMLAVGQQEVVLRARPADDFRAATVKQRPTSRRITQAEINVRRVFNQQTPERITRLVTTTSLQ